jgi:hypothetical protein
MGADAPGPVLAALGVRRDPWTGAFRPPAEAAVLLLLVLPPDSLVVTLRRNVDGAGGAWPPAPSVLA